MKQIRRICARGNGLAKRGTQVREEADDKSVEAFLVDRDIRLMEALREKFTSDFLWSFRTRRQLQSARTRHNRSVLAKEVETRCAREFAATGKRPFQRAITHEVANDRGVSVSTVEKAVKMHRRGKRGASDT